MPTRQSAPALKPEPEPEPEPELTGEEVSARRFENLDLDDAPVNDGHEEDEHISEARFAQLEPYDA